MSFVTLVVEDDVLQRVLLADLLKERGQEVVECTTAEAAEIVLATIGLELRALVTDVQLEGRMSGIELAEFAKARFPHLNVLIVSGREQPEAPHTVRAKARCGLSRNGKDFPLNEWHPVFPGNLSPARSWGNHAISSVVLAGLQQRDLPVE